MSYITSVSRISLLNNLSYARTNNANNPCALCFCSLYEYFLLTYLYIRKFTRF